METKYCNFCKKVLDEGLPITRVDENKNHLFYLCNDCFQIHKDDDYTQDEKNVNIEENEDEFEKKLKEYRKTIEHKNEIALDTFEKLYHNKTDHINRQEKLITDNKVKVHNDICNELNLIYANKNSDYGNSFTETRQKVNGAILVRLYDKVNRLNTLMQGNEQKVKDENIRDTLLDLANYAIMELVEMKLEKE